MRWSTLYPREREPIFHYWLWLFNVVCTICCGGDGLYGQEKSRWNEWIGELDS